MRVFGLTVGGNEANRYLVSFLENVTKTVDVLFYYDDQSTDGSYDIVQSFAPGKILTYRRHDSVPSFLEHEGRFRQDSWYAFEHHLNPSVGDYVLCIDTDEVLVGAGTCTPCEMKPIFEKNRSGVVLLDRPEVWGHDAIGWPLLRTDGYWGTIRCTRLFTYKKNGTIKDVPMACGSEPDWVGKTPNPTPGIPLQLLHYGYATSIDRQDKYERYSKHPGHNRDHIESILKTPQLRPWGGIIPPTMERGKNAS